MGGDRRNLLGRSHRGHPLRRTRLVRTRWRAGGFGGGGRRHNDSARRLPCSFGRGRRSRNDLSCLGRGCLRRRCHVLSRSLRDGGSRSLRRCGSRSLPGSMRGYWSRSLRRRRFRGPGGQRLRWWCIQIRAAVVAPHVDSEVDLSTVAATDRCPAADEILLSVRLPVFQLPLRRNSITSSYRTAIKMIPTQDRRKRVRP